MKNFLQSGDALVAFIGNFDRHGGNWGFVKRDNQYRIVPRINVEKINTIIDGIEGITELRKQFYKSCCSRDLKKSCCIRIAGCSRKGKIYEACNV